MRKTTSPAERMMKKVSPEPNSGCWLFIGAPCNSFGQCRIWLGGRGERQVLVHRLSYEVHVGSIPDGLCVCHSCDIPCCVNPAHLFLGTHYENMHDKLSKGRANMPKGETHHKAKLSEDEALEIISSKATSQALAHKFGVTVRTINLVRCGKNWKHLRRESQP